MLTGQPPYYSKDKAEMFKNRMEKPIDMKPWFKPEATKLLSQLLVLDVKIITMLYFNSLIKDWENTG